MKLNPKTSCVWQGRRGETGALSWLLPSSDLGDASSFQSEEASRLTLGTPTQASKSLTDVVDQQLHDGA